MRISMMVLIALAAAAALSTGAGCPGGFAALLPDGAPAQNAFDERDFSENPGRTAKLHHLVLLHLEASGGHGGDTGKEDGVDEIPYKIERKTALSLGIPFVENHGHWIELLDEDRNVLMLARGAEATSRVELEPGRYIARVHHEQAGSAEAPRATLFLRATRPTSKSQTAQHLDGEGLHNDVFCSGGNVEEDNDDDEDEINDITVWLTGDVSCTRFVNADYSDRFGLYGGELFLIDFDNARDATFQTCNFDGAAISGTLSDSHFEDCALTNIDWDFFTLKGASDLTSCDLTTRVDLSDVTFAGITVNACKFANTKFSRNGKSGANFAGAVIRNCDFSKATLDGAVFDQVTAFFAADNTLSGVSVAGASFQSLDFTGVNMAGIATDWSRVNFGKATMNGVDLSKLTLTGAKFVETNLKKSMCRNNATLTGADFTGAMLDDGDFSFSTLTAGTLDRASAVATNFEGAVLDQISAHGASFTFANLSGASLSAAQLGGAAGSANVPASLAYAYMPNVRITNEADCRNVDFTNAHLYGDKASVQGAELTAANFTGAVISGMDFSGATLESCSFENAQAVATKFIGARVSDAKFDSAYLMGADFTNAIATGASFVDAAISTGPCSDAAGCASCDGCKFSELDPANLCCYSFSERDGTVYAVSFLATILPTDSSIICPSGDVGPCAGVKLVARDEGPFPAVPACVPTPINWCEAPTQ